jgi:hypothetical protein
MEDDLCAGLKFFDLVTHDLIECTMDGNELVKALSPLGLLVMVETGRA